MGTKKLNEIGKVTTINTNDYIVMNAADGAPVQIKKSDFVAAILEVMPVANTEKNGLNNKLYAKSGSKSISPGKSIDIGVTHGLIMVFSSSSGHSAVVLAAHHADTLKLISQTGASFSIEDIDAKIVIYKEEHGGNVKIKNNHESLSRSITYHTL